MTRNSPARSTRRLLHRRGLRPPLFVRMALAPSVPCLRNNTRAAGEWPLRKVIMCASRRPPASTIPSSHHTPLPQWLEPGLAWHGKRTQKGRRNQTVVWRMGRPAHTDVGVLRECITPVVDRRNLVSLGRSRLRDLRRTNARTGLYVDFIFMDDARTPPLPLRLGVLG